MEPQVQTKEFKAFPITLTKEIDDEQGIVEAIVSVFNNVDMGKEIIRPGYFAKSLKRKLPKGVWMHDWTKPIAKTLEARELLPGDPLLPGDIRQLGGLYVKSQFNRDTQRGREAYSDIKFGIVDEFSIGYTNERTHFDEDLDALELLEGTLHEWSPVLVGMNPATSVLGIKALEDKLRAGMSFEEHSSLVLAANEEFGKRAQSLLDIRAKEGRTISAANRTKIESALVALEDLERVKGVLKELLALSEPRASEEDTAKARTQFLRLMTRRSALLRSN